MLSKEFVFKSEIRMFTSEIKVDIFASSYVQNQLALMFLLCFNFPFDQLGKNVSFEMNIINIWLKVLFLFLLGVAVPFQMETEILPTCPVISVLLLLAFQRHHLKRLHFTMLIVS